MDDLLYKKNILALSSIDPELSFSLCTVTASSSTVINTARNGIPVPSVKKRDSLLQLHSLYNPVAEAEKLYSSARHDSGFIIIYGIGAGYHIVPYLNDNNVENILIIDTDIRYFRKILENINLTQILTNPKVSILIDPDRSVLEKVLTEKYFPSVFGNLSIVQLKNRVISETTFFEKLTAIINSILDNISNDFASQAFFGKRWFKNIINNMRYAQEAQILPRSSGKAAIVGAGPSLEKQLDFLRKESGSSLILASDTSAGLLVSHGIIPDYIISIDCQHITYNHLEGTDLSGIPVIMDLGSPLFMSRYFSKRIYFTSANPLSRFIASGWRYFQFIDTAGGNVGYSALSIAGTLGIEEATLYGIDYSYTDYKPYARGTFLYRHFGKNSCRMNPLENSVYSFSSSGSLNRITSQGRPVYTNTRMDYYYNSMLSLIARNNIEVINAPYSPRKFNTKKRKGINSPSLSIFSSGKPNMSWQDFIANYRDSLSSLPQPISPFIRYSGNLSKRERELWTTLYPVCAGFRKEIRDNAIDTPGILEKTREWCISVLDDVLCNK